jgi:hypothetical protein
MNQLESRAATVPCPFQFYLPISAFWPFPPHNEQSKVAHIIQMHLNSKSLGAVWVYNVPFCASTSFMRVQLEGESQ